MIDIQCTLHVQDKDRFLKRHDWIGLPADIDEANSQLLSESHYVQFADWFEGNAYAIAKQGDSVPLARELLSQAYLGADAFGIGLTWKTTKAV